MTTPPAQPELAGTPFDYVIDPTTLREVLTHPDRLSRWLDGQLRAPSPAESSERRRHHTDIGVAARMLGRLEIGIEHLRLALELAEADASAPVWAARVRLAHALHWAGNFTAATAQFVQAEREAEDEGPIARSFVHQHSGKYYFDQGDMDAARLHFAEALRLRGEANADASLIQSSWLALDAIRRVDTNGADTPVKRPHL